MTEINSLPCDASGAITLDQIASMEPVQRHIGRNMSKASVLFYGAAGSGIALKTYRSNNIAARNLAGRVLIARETRAYERASGIDGLPKFLGRISPFELATEWVDAKPLAHRRGEILEAGIFDRIEEIVGNLHERGIAIGDLHILDVLLGQDATVWLIDFAAAFCLGDRPGVARSGIFKRLKGNDIVNMTRMRAQFTGLDVDEALGKIDPEILARYRRGRKIKSAWDWLRRKKQ